MTQRVYILVDANNDHTPQTAYRDFQEASNYALLHDSEGPWDIVEVDLVEADAKGETPEIKKGRATPGLPLYQAIMVETSMYEYLTEIEHHRDTGAHPEPAFWDCPTSCIECRDELYQAVRATVDDGANFGWAHVDCVANAATDGYCLLCGGPTDRIDTDRYQCVKCGYWWQFRDNSLTCVDDEGYDNRCVNLDCGELIPAFNFCVYCGTDQQGT